MKVMRRSLALTAAVVLALTGCSTGSDDEDAASAPPDDGLLAAYGLDGLDGPEIVDTLERASAEERQPDLIASVRPGELHLGAAGDDELTVLALPDELFYLSVAPYAEHTHDCHYHSLTTCQGELVGETLAVTITDRDTGEVLVDEATETFDNGFVGYWLPADIDATIEITHDGRTGQQDISTGVDDPTCLTTLQLV